MRSLSCTQTPDIFRIPTNAVLKPPYNTKYGKEDLEYSIRELSSVELRPSGSKRFHEYT